MRKPFEELTPTELTALSTEEITRYVDLECAEQGIPLLPDRAPQPPDKADIAPDQIGYHVSFTFERREDAAAIGAQAEKFQQLKSEYTPGIKGYVQRYVRIQLGEPTSIEEVKQFSEQRIATLGAQISANEEAKEQYNRDRAEWDRVMERRNRISSGFSSKISEARRELDKVAEYRRTFARYLDLAEGVRRTACRFMVASRPDAPTVIPDCFEADEQGPMPVGKRQYEVEEEQPAEI